MNAVEKILRNDYGLKPFLVKKLDIDSTNDLYYVKADKEYFLKELFSYPSLKEDNIRAQLHLAEHLYKKGFKTIVALPNKKGNLITKRGKWYILFPYIITTPTKNTVFNDAVKILADFHKQLEDYEIKYEFHAKPMHTETADITTFIEPDLRHNKKSVLYKAREQKNKFSKKILKDSNLIMSSIIMVLHNLKDLKFTKQSILHYDYKKENLLYNNDKFLAITDFDFSHKGYIETDIAKAAKYWSEKQDGTLDIPKFKEFVNKYNYYNTCSLDWKLYYVLVIYVLLRRIVHVSHMTLEKRANLDYLYDRDMKTLRFIIANQKKFLR
ncbi:MAG: phosphotransferase [Candidatus Woesearchaeota archaeon]